MKWPRFSSIRERVGLTAAALLVAGIAWIAYVELIAKPFMREKFYEKCFEYFADATSEKCNCLADSMTQRFGSHGYVDRLFYEETFPREEVDQIKLSCGLSLE